MNNVIFYNQGPRARQPYTLATKEYIMDFLACRIHVWDIIEPIHISNNPIM